MNRKIKKMLREHYVAPMPQRKREFVAKWKKPKIHIGEMIFLQLRYISKWHLVLSLLLLGIMMGISRYISLPYMGVLYGLVPFLVMLSVTESMRSFRFGMTELEGAALFSLKSIIMMRMLLLGMGNMFILLVLAFIRSNRWMMEFVYLLVPYFITAAGGLAIFRKHSGMEGNYMCLALSAGISVLQGFIYCSCQNLYEAEYNSIWVAICGLLAVALGRQIRRTFVVMAGKKEDLAWD